jgi:RNA recognition motif-containing protein
VEYATHATASDAVRRLDGVEFKDRKVHVRYDRTELERSGGPAVFVGNLPWSTTDEELLGLFADFHPISSTVMKNMAGRSRGFAIVRFNDTNRAENAIASMNGVELGGRILEVRCPCLSGCILCSPD